MIAKFITILMFFIGIFCTLGFIGSGLFGDTLTFNAWVMAGWIMATIFVGVLLSYSLPSKK